MPARDEVLRRVRAALRDAPPAGPVDTAAVPAQPAGPVDTARLVARFVDRLVDYRATVRTVGAAGLPATIVELLTASPTDAVRSPGTVVVPADLPAQWLAGYPGPVRPDLPPVELDALDAASAVVTGCAVAIAETGTIVLDAGAGQGRRALTLVPDHHVCVVHVGQIVADVPDALRLLVGTRPLTFISGPSATSDIELSRVEGVHGPRRLDVIVCR